MSYRILDEIGAYIVVKYMYGEYGVKSKDGKTVSGRIEHYDIARRLAEAFNADSIETDKPTRCGVKTTGKAVLRM